MSRKEASTPRSAPCRGRGNHHWHPAGRCPRRRSCQAERCPCRRSCRAGRCLAARRSHGLGQLKILGIKRASLSASSNVLLIFVFALVHLRIKHRPTTYMSSSCFTLHALFTLLLFQLPTNNQQQQHSTFNNNKTTTTTNNQVWLLLAAGTG